MKKIIILYINNFTLFKLYGYIFIKYNKLFFDLNQMAAESYVVKDKYDPSN